MSEGALQSGLPPANDRMLTTVFLAALLHGIVILGVSFSTPDRDPDGEAARALEVVLVDDRAPSVKLNPDARYLAQRTQRGSGNTLAAERALIPKSSPLSTDSPGVPGGDGTVLGESGAAPGGEDVLAAHVRSPKILYFASRSAAKAPSELPMLLEKRPDWGMTPNDDGVELRMRGEAKNQLWITADTRESDVALYLDRWRRKVEHVGTLNFPSVARRGTQSGTPVVEVTIGADGRLAQALIRRSSGHPELDDAAIRILRMAAPFDPFPADLGQKHDQIRIAYEWQFLDGTPEGSSVFYSDTPAGPENP